MKEDITMQEVQDLTEIVIDTVGKKDLAIELAEEGYTTIVPVEQQEALELLGSNLVGVAKRRRIYFACEDGSRVFLRLPAHKAGHRDGSDMLVDAEKNPDLTKRALAHYEWLGDNAERLSGLVGKVREVCLSCDTLDEVVEKCPAMKVHVVALREKYRLVEEEKINTLTEALG